MSNEIGVTEQELLRFASTLENSLDGLVEPTNTDRAPVNAGRATAAVAQTFQMYYSALAGIAMGVEKTAHSVTTSRTQYVEDDNEAAAGMPQGPLPESQAPPDLMPTTPTPPPASDSSGAPPAAMPLPETDQPNLPIPGTETP